MIFGKQSLPSSAQFVIYLWIITGWLSFCKILWQGVKDGSAWQATARKSLKPSCQGPLDPPQRRLPAPWWLDSFRMLTYTLWKVFPSCMHLFLLWALAGKPSINLFTRIIHENSIQTSYCSSTLFLFYLALFQTDVLLDCENQIPRSCICNIHNPQLVSYHLCGCHFGAWQGKRTVFSIIFSYLKCAIAYILE